MVQAVFRGIEDPCDAVSPEFPGAGGVDSEGNRLDYKPVTLKPLSVESIPPKKRTF